MIIWQSTLTDEHVAHINTAAIDEMVDELNDAVAIIVDSYGLEFPA